MTKAAIKHMPRHTRISSLDRRLGASGKAAGVVSGASANVGGSPAILRREISQRLVLTETNLIFEQLHRQTAGIATRAFGRQHQQRLRRA